MIWGSVIALFGCILVGYLFALNRDKSHDLGFSDLVARDGQLSTTKILQIVGGAVGTWIVIKLTLTSGISWDIFAIYLAYVASVDGFSKVITAKYSNGQQSYNRYPQIYGHLETQERQGSAKTPEE